MCVLTLMGVVLVMRVCGQGLSTGVSAVQTVLLLDCPAWGLLQNVLNVQKCEVIYPSTQGCFRVHCCAQDPLEQLPLRWERQSPFLPALGDNSE